MERRVLFSYILFVVLSVSAAPADPPLVSVNINVSAPLDQLPASLFGLDLEFTRHDVFSGLSAELLANRFFAIQPAGTSWPVVWPAGTPPRWSGIGAPAFGALLWDDTGVTGGVVCTVGPSSGPCGVQQAPFADGFQSGVGFGSAIGVQAGGTYVLSLVASASNCGSAGGLTLLVSLEGVFSASLFVPESSTAGEPWVTLQANFTAPLSLPMATLTLSTSAGEAGTLTLNTTSLVPTAGVASAASPLVPGAAVRGDVLASLGGLRFRGPLRYPGGCFAPFYAWKAGLSPRLVRAPIATPPNYCDAVSGGVNAYTDGFLENGPNVDEYIQLCTALGVMPAITLSLQFGTAAELAQAADLVEYMNGPPSSVWGGLRASRGYPQPYNVTLWYAGNEINGQARYADYPASTEAQGPPSPAEYGAMLIALTAAIQAVDAGSSMSVLAVEGGPGWDGAWVAAAAGAGQALPHATSFHGGYATASGPGGSPDSPAGFSADAKVPDVAFLQGLQALRASLDSLNASSVYISADEWGLGPPWDVLTFNVAHGMFGASFLTTLLSNAAANSVAYSNYFEPINEGAITVRQFDAGLTPLGSVLQLFSGYANCARLGSSVDDGGSGSSSGSDSSDSPPDVVGIAALCEGGVVLLTLSNRNSTQGYAVSVGLSGGGGQPVMPSATDATFLVASGLESDSVFLNSSAAGMNASGITFLPPYSILQFEYLL